MWDPAPRPVAVLGQHVMPARTGAVRYVSGDAMSLADSFAVTFHAGLKENIIPDTAEIALNVRTPTPEVREKVSASIERILTAEALAAGAPEPTVERYNSFPRTHNDVGGFESEDFADNPANHTPQFGPVMEPTLTTGVHAALAGLLHYVGR